MRKKLHELTQRHHFTDGHAYDRHSGRVFGGMYRQVAKDVGSAAPTGGTVLDAGCGSGQLAAEIATRRPDLRVRGVDLEPGMVAAASERAKRESLADRVEFTVGDLATLPLPDDSVDLIVSTASLHHWTDTPEVVASLGRVLRPGGRMWIYDMRWVKGDDLRSAASRLDRRVDRTLIRTGWVPAALFQRFAIAPARD